MLLHLFFDICGNCCDVQSALPVTETITPFNTTRLVMYHRLHLKRHKGVMADNLANIYCSSKKTHDYYDYPSRYDDEECFWSEIIKVRQDLQLSARHLPPLHFSVVRYPTKASLEICIDFGGGWVGALHQSCPSQHLLDPLIFSSSLVFS